MRKKILIIEDDRRVLEILSFALGREGYEIIRAADGLAGLQLAVEHSPDLIVLDVAQPLADSISPLDSGEICRCLREDGVTVPILVLVSSEDEREDVSNAGADESIKKPFAMRELLTRARVNTWHLEASSAGRAGVSKRQVFGRIVIDPDEVVVLKDGVALDLTQREYDLFCFLAKKPGTVYSREELMRHVWEYTGYVGDVRAVDVSIRRLREKIEDDPANPTIILTRRGRGYLVVL